jgi:hypothetical protein
MLREAVAAIGGAFVLGAACSDAPTYADADTPSAGPGGFDPSGTQSGVQGSGGTAPPPSAASGSGAAPSCKPDCSGRECGSDGCQGSCGDCQGAEDVCVDGLCECKPACDGKQCGPDGCGGVCGECPSGYFCNGVQCVDGAGDSSGVSVQSSDSVTAVSSVDTAAAGCFVAGTPIRMADGTTRPIERIAVGDRVLAFDEATGDLVTGTVSRTFESARSEPLVLVNGELTVTPRHRFRVHHGWVRAEDLQPGDPLTRPAPPRDARAAGTGVELVRSLAELGVRERVYNFTVERYHAYVAGGVVVHNLKFDDVAERFAPEEQR